LPTIWDKLSLEPVTSPPIKKSITISSLRLLIQRRMKSKHVQTRWEVEMEKNFK
jgi:hypothetical protein